MASRTAMTALNRTQTQLTRREFFAEIAEAIRRSLPAERSEFESRQTMNLLKIHYGANYRIHYEIWINTERRHIEVGLHFEDGPASTEKLLQHFDKHILEIKDILGVEVELERWTQSWGHLFEVHPLEPLTNDLIQRLAQRVVQQILLLQPLLDDAYEQGLAPRTPRPSTFHERFRNRRR